MAELDPWLKFAVGIATAVGIHAAKGIIKPLAPVTTPIGTAFTVLKMVDDTLCDAAAASVQEANRDADGSMPMIVVLDAKHITTAMDLKKIVYRNGGTAWFQAETAGRLQPYWTPSKSFVPRKTSKGIQGAIAHGNEDNQYFQFRQGDDRCKQSVPAIRK